MGLSVLEVDRAWILIGERFGGKWLRLLGKELARGGVGVGYVDYLGLILIYTIVFLTRTFMKEVLD